MLDSEKHIRNRLLSRILIGADTQTADAILAMGDEMTISSLLNAVAKIDTHISMGGLVIKYGVTERQAKEARMKVKKTNGASHDQKKV